MMFLLSTIFFFLQVCTSNVALSEEQPQEQSKQVQKSSIWERDETKTDEQDSDDTSSPSIETQLSSPPLQSYSSQAGQQLSSGNGGFQTQIQYGNQIPMRLSQQQKVSSHPSFQMTSGGSSGGQSSGKIHLFDPLNTPRRRPQRVGPQGPPPHGGFEASFGGPGGQYGPPQPFRAGMGGPMNNGFMQNAGGYMSPNNWMSGPQGIAAGVIPSLMFMASPGILIPPSPPMFLQQYSPHGLGLPFHGQGPQFQNQMYSGYQPMQGGQGSQYGFQRPINIKGKGPRRPKRPGKKVQESPLKDDISEDSSSTKPKGTYVIQSNEKPSTDGNAKLITETPKKIESAAPVETSAQLPSDDSKVKITFPDSNSNQTKDSEVFAVGSNSNGTDRTSVATERDGLSDNLDVTSKGEISKQALPSGQGSTNSGVNIAALPAGGSSGTLTMNKPQGYLGLNGGSTGEKIIQSNGGGLSSGGGIGGWFFGLGGSGGQSGSGGGKGQSNGEGTGGFSFGGTGGQGGIGGQSFGGGIGGLSTGEMKTGGEPREGELRAESVGGDGESGGQMNLGGTTGGLQVGGGGQSQTGGSQIKLITMPSAKKSPTIKLQTIGAPAMSGSMQQGGSFSQGGNPSNIRLITVPGQGKSGEGSLQQNGQSSVVMGNGEGSSSRQIVIQNGEGGGMGRYANGEASMMEFLAKHPGLGKHQSLSRYQMYPNSFLVTPIKTKLQRPMPMMDGNFSIENLSGQTTGANARKWTIVQGSNNNNNLAATEGGKDPKK